MPQYLLIILCVLLSNIDGDPTIRCGLTWGDANTNCYGMCTDNSQCEKNYSCFNNLAPCSSPSPLNSSSPTTPPSPPSPPFPPSFDSCEQSIHNLSLSELNQFMGRTPSDESLVNWYQPLNIALTRYSMNCPLRIAAFLAQVRHETAGMSVFHQTADNGAGTLHMIPANWHYVCAGVPEIETAFANLFPNCTNCLCTVAMSSNPLGADATEAAIQIFSQPLLASLSGTWWFATGASTPSIFGWKGCGDLRLDADVGLGSAGPSDCYHKGYYQITCCIYYTIGGASGLAQRIQYYDDALAVISNWTITEPVSVSHPVTDKISVPAIIGISIGVVVVVVLLVVVVLVVVIHNVRSQPVNEVTYEFEK